LPLLKFQPSYIQQAVTILHSNASATVFQQKWDLSKGQQNGPHLMDLYIQ